MLVCATEVMLDGCTEPLVMAELTILPLDRAGAADSLSAECIMEACLRTGEMIVPGSQAEWALWLNGRGFVDLYMAGEAIVDGHVSRLVVRPTERGVVHYGDLAA